MEGELFTIRIINVEPLCVKVSHSIPFAYHEKLSYVALVTEATEWCMPVVVTPKKGTDNIRLCMNLPSPNRYVHKAIPYAVRSGHGLCSK